MKDIEQRVQLLYGVLSFPVSQDDHAEKARRAELQKFVFTHIHINLLTPLSGGLMESLQNLNHFLNSMHF